MLQKTGYALEFGFQFTSMGVGKTGLPDIVVYVWRGATMVRNGVSVTGEVGRGLYRYVMPAEYNDAPANYYAAAVTADTSVDYREIASLWVTGLPWVNRAGGGDGANEVDITVINGDSVAISGVSIEIWNADNTFIVASNTTDENGRAVFYLEESDYTVRLRKSGISFEAHDLTVSGSETVTYSGTVLSEIIGSPPASSQCRIYEWCFSADDESPLSTISATAKIVGLPYDYNGRLHTGEKIPGTYDNSSGLLYWNLVRGAKVRFDIEVLGVNKNVTIPEQSAERLSALT